MALLAPNGSVLAVNPAWGLGTEAVHDYNVFADDDLGGEPVRPLVERAFRGEHVEVPGGAARGDGLITRRASLHPLVDDTGVLEAVLLVEQQVDEDDEADGGLRASEKRFRDLFEHSPISLYEEDFSAVRACIDEIR